MVVTPFKIVLAVGILMLIFLSFGKGDLLFSEFEEPLAFCLAVCFGAWLVS